MTTETTAASEAGGFQLPWSAIPKFVPGTTDVTEYSRKLQFLAAMWPKDSLHLLAPRAALLCEGTAFKKIASLPPEKLKSTDDSGIKLIVSTLGGSWGKTKLEEKYDCFEKAIYGTTQKADETNDSYLARHDVHFEELIAQGVSLKEVRAYILLRQSQLTSEDRKKIVVEMGGTLEYDKVCSAIRLLGSRFFADLQGQRGNAKSKTYDANVIDEIQQDEPERAFQAASSPMPEEAEVELDAEYIEAMVAHEDQDALQVQAFEEELEGFFQETPELQDALVSYLEARNRLLQKRKSRGFWPVGGTGKGSKGGRGFKGKGKGKPGRDQLLARIARSTCRACGEKGHWKAECPKYGRPGSMSQKGEATTTVAEVAETFTTTASPEDSVPEVLTSVPEEAISLDEAHFAESLNVQRGVLKGLHMVVQNLKSRQQARKTTITRQRSAGQASWTDCPMENKPRTAWDSEPQASAKSFVKGCATAFLSTETVEAILDTGASRCVMGKRLLSTFVSQLSDATRAAVKVVKSAVKFRFGNNQTLVSEQRILLPFHQGHQKILWLAIEIVPGGTPLLWSKKAIKQLGGVIDTTEDVCHLKRLQKSLSLRTGPTGLYLVDLARLCNESDQEQQCQAVNEQVCQVMCEDRSNDQCCHPSRMHAVMKFPDKPIDANLGCIDSYELKTSREAENSISGYRKYPEPVNDSLQKPENPSACTRNSGEVKLLCPAARESAQDQTACTAFHSAGPLSVSPHVRAFRVSRAAAQQPWSSLRQAVRSHSEVQHGRSREDVSGRYGKAHDQFRPCNERPDLRVRCGERARLDQVDVRAHAFQSKAVPQGFSALCGKVHHPSRGARGRSASRLRGARARSRSPHGECQAQGGAQDGSGVRVASSERRTVGPCVRHRGRRSASRQSGYFVGHSHDPNGECHAASVGGHPAALRSSAECVSTQSSGMRRSMPERSFQVLALDKQAQQLCHAQACLNECVRFLKNVPWHLLKESRETRSHIEGGSQDSARPAAYVSFGMFMHGGVVGITNVTKRYPGLTRLLSRVVRLTDDKHRFTSISVSCNSSAHPHRDKYNAHHIGNLVVPLCVPRKGGEVWVNAPPPSSRHPSAEMLCGDQRKAGHLVSLQRGAVFIHPHTLHATAQWEGDRTVMVGYALKYAPKLPAASNLWLRRHGFSLPSLMKFSSEATKTSCSAQNANTGPAPAPQRPVLVAATAATEPPSRASDLQAVSAACEAALQRAERVYQDSQLTTSAPREPELDLLEITCSPDSRLSQAVRERGGRAKRYNLQEVDWTSEDSRQEFWSLVRRLQPRHIWIAPDMRHWCSWSSLNAAKSTLHQQKSSEKRAADKDLFQVVVQLFDWQKRHGRQFHFEITDKSKIEDVPELQKVIKGSYRSTVDMCSFGLKTPVSQVPIRKRTVILSTCRDLTKSLIAKMCPGNHQHQPLAGRSLHGVPLSQFAGTFCQEFARHIADQLLRADSDGACAAEAEVPRTRKRFKTSLGNPQPITQIGAQKRTADPASESDIRGRPQPRVTLSPQSSDQLPMSEWQTVCERAAQCTSQAAHMLVPAQDELVAMLQQKLEPLQLIQVFVSRKARNLQSPLGAVPATVARVRISLGCKTTRDGQMTLECLGNEDRTTMLPERKKQRIGALSFLITIFANPRLPAEASNISPDPPSTASQCTLQDGATGESTNPELSSAARNPPDLEGWAPPPVPLHGPAFRNLSRESKTQLIRIHNNLGHPAPQTLANHLKAAGENPEMIQAALDYQCDVCLESTEPRHQRPSKLPSPLEFNDLVGVDGFFFKGQSGYRAYVIHSLDEASCFHLGRRVTNRHSSLAIKSLSEFWMSWAGNPKKVYLDPAGEFRSEEIMNNFQSMNIKAFVTAAAWQRGKLERHGDIVKDMLRRLDLQSPLANDEIFDQALLQAFQAKNALVRHQGYAPEQIVLGKSLRVPGSLSSDDDVTSHIVTEGEDLEAEMHRRRLDLRCQARKVFWDADNSQTLRRALLRRSNPQRGPYRAGDWVLYWLSKTSPNRLAAGRWHGPAKVISQEGQSIVWVSHGTTILRCAPENLRPASLREWQQLSSYDSALPHKNTGGASTFVDLTLPNAPTAMTHLPGSHPEATADMPAVISSGSQGTRATPSEEEIQQPEQEMTPQVSTSPEGGSAAPREVEREASQPASAAAPSVFPSADSVQPPESVNAQPVTSAPVAPLDAATIPVPDSEEGLCGEQILLACEPLSGFDDSLMTFTSLEAGPGAVGAVLAEDALPYVEFPLDCGEHQAYCLEIPVKAKDMKRWPQETSPEQLVTLAAAGKRARAEVHIKDLSPAEVQLFNEAKQKEIQCWIQTSAIRGVLRQKLNPEQILKSRWILTWKSPEPGESQRRAKARLVVLGFQDPKLVDVMRDAPTLSKEVF